MLLSILEQRISTYRTPYNINVVKCWNAARNRTFWFLRSIGYKAHSVFMLILSLVYIHSSDFIIIPLQESIVGRLYQSPWKPRTSPCISCFTQTSCTLSKVSKQSGVHIILAGRRRHKDHLPSGRRRHKDHLPSRVLRMVSVLLCEKLRFNWFLWLKLSWEDRKNRMKQGKQSKWIKFNCCHQERCIKILLACLQTWVVLVSVELSSALYPIIEWFCIERLLGSFKNKIAERRVQLVGKARPFWGSWEN